MNILLVVPENLFPNNHGRVIDILSRLNLLIEKNHTVDIIITSNQTNQYIDDLKQLGIRNILFVNRSFPFKYILGLQPYQIASRSNLHKFDLSSQNYDRVILETIFVSDILKAKGINKGATIIRVHNDEVIYAKQLVKSNPSWIKKILFTIESYLIKKVQANILTKASHLWFISSEEQQRLGVQHLKTNFVPPCIKSKMAKEITTTSKNVLFIGNLTTSTNINGLLWYIKNVHSQLLKCNPEYKLTIAGSCKEITPEIKYLQQTQRINVILNTDNTDELYKNATLFINPISFGAGLKLKTIEAIANNLPVISTPNGFEGSKIPLNKEFTFNNEDECINLINTIINNPRLQTKILQTQKQVIEKYYTYDINNYL